MDSGEILKGIKIAFVIYLGYIIVTQVSNPQSIYGNYLWMFLIALLAVGATFMFSSLIRRYGT